MFALPDGTQVTPGLPFTDATGVQRPGNWMEKATADEIKAAGVTVQPDPPEPERYDERFYFSAGNPRDLAQCKASQIAQIKQVAGSMLAPSDYKVLREVGGGSAIKAEVKAFRTAVRAYSNTVEDEVNACKTMAALEKWAALSLEWPVDPNAPARI